MSIRWPPPRFDLCDREGAPHDATFTMACFVWSYKSAGRGKSKKQAKRLAAYNMYEMLRDAPEVLELWQKRAEVRHFQGRTYSWGYQRFALVQRYTNSLGRNANGCSYILVTGYPNHFGHGCVAFCRVLFGFFSQPLILKSHCSKKINLCYRKLKS